MILSEIRGGQGGTGTGFCLFSCTKRRSPYLHTHLSPHAVWDIPDQATHYRTLSPELEASFLTRN